MVEAYESDLEAIVGEATKAEDINAVALNADINQDMIIGDNNQGTDNVGHTHTASGTDGDPLPEAGLQDEAVTNDKIYRDNKQFIFELNNDPGGTPIYSTSSTAAVDYVLDTNTWWLNKMVRVIGKFGILGLTAAPMTTEIHVANVTSAPSGGAATDWKYSTGNLATRASDIVDRTIKVTASPTKIVTDIAVTDGGSTDTYSISLYADGAGRLALQYNRDAVNFGNTMYQEYQISLEVKGELTL